MFPRQIPAGPTKPIHGSPAAVKAVNHAASDLPLPQQQLLRPLRDLLLLLLQLFHELRHLRAAFALRVLAVALAGLHALQRVVQHADQVVVLVHRALVEAHVHALAAFTLEGLLLLPAVATATPWAGLTHLAHLA